MNDIVDMNYKKLVSLRNAREKRLIEEAKIKEKELSTLESKSIRDEIMRK